jgi:UDP-N-acetylglucosamine 2-epimerase
MSKLKVMTVLGTRPEIIRLSRIIARLEQWTDHVLTHTGQNYDYELNEIFFEELHLRRPDHFLEADTSSLGAVLGDVLKGTERVLLEECPDAVVVLGDTNSCISALMARRMKIPVYHLEAGNRAHDPNVPEEINRHLVDHVADYNLVYSEHSRRNLLSEGLSPARIALMGSPMREVLEHYGAAAAASDVLERLALSPGGYLLASMHREENVDDPPRLKRLMGALEACAKDQDVPVLISTHPRTRKRIADAGISFSDRLTLHPPLGYLDYLQLQRSARCVISDSGTIAEESSILGFPAVTIRDAIERPEAVEVGGIIVTGSHVADVLDAVRMTLEQHRMPLAVAAPYEYGFSDTSRRVVNFIRSTAATHNQRAGVRVVSPLTDREAHQ